MTITFLNQYLKAPPKVREFIYSKEYYQLLENYFEKFEIDFSKQTNFVYLIQDLVFRVFVPKSIMELKDEIKSKLELSEEISNQLAYFLFNRLLPKINKLWQEAETELEQEVLSPETSELIKKIKEIKKKTKPTKVLNLQKIIPIKKETKKQPVVNIQKLIPDKNGTSPQPKVIKIQVPKIETEEMKPHEEKMPTIDQANINIPSLKTEELTPTSWTEKKEKEKKDKDKEESKITVVIKKPKPTKSEDEVIDLSSY